MLQFGRARNRSASAYDAWVQARQAAPHGDNRKGSIAHILDDLHATWEHESPGMHAKIVEVKPGERPHRGAPGRTGVYAFVVNGREVYVAKNIYEPGSLLGGGGVVAAWLAAFARGASSPDKFPAFGGILTARRKHA